MAGLEPPALGQPPRQLADQPQHGFVARIALDLARVGHSVSPVAPSTTRSSTIAPDVWNTDSDIAPPVATPVATPDSTPCKMLSPADTRRPRTTRAT